MEKITADNPLSKSADIMQLNLETLKSLFPTIVKEGKIDVTELQALLGEELENDEEYYRFTWAGKSQARQEANKPSTGTLRPAKEESKDWDTTGNIFIEGDNLEVLKLMQKSYANKIKMIYIDPPYNTGKDFVYKDNYADNLGNYLSITGQTNEEGKKLSTNTESDGRYHSNWLNMMYPRLKLARNLLSEDGIILVNMDEHEIVNLTKILEEIFGENNDIGTIIWDKRNPKGDARGVAYQHEYILTFAKNKDTFLLNHPLLRPKKNAQTILDKGTELFLKNKKNLNIDELNKEFLAWLNAQIGIGIGEKAYNKIDEEGRVYQSVSMAWPNKKKAPEDYFVPLVHPVTKKQCPVPPRGWRNPSSTMQKLLDENLIIFGLDENTQPRRKYFLLDNMNENLSSLLYYGGSDTDLLEKLDIPFDTPKVVNIYKEHINSFTDNRAIILDFFAGSGTSAHATMQLNSEDGGNRKFICVQLPEVTPAESEARKAGYETIADIAKERIRRAGEKIKSEMKEDLFTKEGKSLDIGFRDFKLDSSNIKAWDGDVKKFQENLLSASENIKEDRTEEDVLYEVLLKSGLDLAQPIEEKVIAGKKVFNIGVGALFICLADDLTTDVAEGIGKWKQELEPATCRVIFKDTGFTDVEKTNSIQILKRFGITEVNTI
jgi:adenine-specific DNA-methyltransferase